MKNIILIISLFSATTFASNEQVYKTLIKDLEYAVGEKSNEPNDQLVLIDRITTMASYRKEMSEDNQAIITEGNFLMLAPKKSELTSFDKKHYSDFFNKDSFGSAFLYKNYIITNYHMCRGLNTLIKDYRDKIYAVKVLKWDDKQDICILQAPKSVMSQRNFSTYKAPVDLVENEKRDLRIKIKIEKLLSKKYTSTTDARELDNLRKELGSENNSYATVYSIWGEFKINKIEKDVVDDEWSKKNSYQAFGSKCKSGISGGAVANHNGLLGYSWAAETPSSMIKRVKEMDDRKPSAQLEEEKQPICYFIDTKEIDRVIGEYESSLKVK